MNASIASSWNQHWCLQVMSQSRLHHCQAPYIPASAHVLVPLSMPYSFWALHLEIAIKSLLSPVYPTHQSNLVDGPWKSCCCCSPAQWWGTGEPWDLRLNSQTLTWVWVEVFDIWVTPDRARDLGCHLCIPGSVSEMQPWAKPLGHQVHLHCHVRAACKSCWWDSDCQPFSGVSWIGRRMQPCYSHRELLVAPAPYLVHTHSSLSFVSKQNAISGPEMLSC